MARGYKDSGIEWIGRIPKEWKMQPLSIYFGENSKPNFNLDSINALQFKYGEIIQKPTNGRELNDKDFELLSKYTMVAPNDIVVNGLNLNYDLKSLRIARVREEGIITSAYIVLRPRNGANSSFYNYYLKALDFQKVFHGMGVGIRLTLSYNELRGMLLPVPSFEEQKRIADYLDEKCGEIDSLISLQEQMIAQLSDYKQSVITEAVTKGLDPNAQLVPSGIDWIGDVPEGWKLARMDYICSVITDFVASGSFESLRENVPYLDTPDYAMLVRTADLSGTAKSDKRVYISEHSYIFLKNSNLFGEEIVLPNIGASVGDVYMVPAGLYEKMSLGPNSIMLKTKYCDRYYYYYYYGEPGKRSVINMCQSTAQPKFNKTELRSLRVLLPPLEEQRAIASYLDGRCAEIDSLISLKQQKIEKLKEYKKSLIFEAVTGKKEIV